MAGSPVASTIFDNIRRGQGHLQYAFHVYGYPYCLCTHGQIADDINTLAQAKNDIFGYNYDVNDDNHSQTCKAFPAAISIPTDESVTIQDVCALPENDGWDFVVYDKQYEVSGNSIHEMWNIGLKPLVGIQCIPQHDTDGVLCTTSTSVLPKSSYVIDVADPEGAIATHVATGNYMWIGNECVYISGSSDNGDGTIALAIDSYHDPGLTGRGLFRSVEQSHFGSVNGIAAEFVSSVPLGTISGRGCALWAAAYDSNGQKISAFHKIRHGKVKTTQTRNDGIIKIKVAAWTDWLNNDHEINRGDVRFGRYIFTRPQHGESRQSDPAWFGPPNGPTRYAHFGVAIKAEDDSPMDTHFHDVWLCDQGDTVVFDHPEEIFEALSLELQRCWDGDSLQYSGYGTTASPYHHWALREVGDNYDSKYSVIFKPVVVGNTIDVKQMVDTFEGNPVTEVTVRFYGIIPWLFGMGAMQGNSKAFFDDWCDKLTHPRPFRLGYQIYERDPYEKIHFVYPYSTLKTGKEKLYKTKFDVIEDDIEAMPWTCEYYYDMNIQEEVLPQYCRTPDDSFGTFYQNRYPLKGFPIPKQTELGGPVFRMYIRDGYDPSVFRNDEMIAIEQEDALQGEGNIGAPLLGAVYVTGQDINDKKYIEFRVETNYGVPTSCDLDPTIPALVDFHSRFHFDQWSSLFYCPGSSQDDTFGGDPFIMRTMTRWNYFAAYRPLQVLLGSDSTSPPISRFSQLDHIPDASGDFNQPSTIDWASFAECFRPIVPTHKYAFAPDRNVNLASVINAEMALHGITCSWEPDSAKNQYVIKFRPLSKPNASTAASFAVEIDRTVTAADVTPEVRLNDRYRFNKITFSADKNEDGDFDLMIPIESRAAKVALGRTEELSIESQMSKFGQINRDPKNLAILTDHLKSVLGLYCADYPVINTTLTGKAFFDVAVGDDLLFTDARVVDPYTGVVGVSNRTARVLSKTTSLTNLSQKVTLQLTGRPMYGWAPAAYSKISKSYFNGDDDLVFVVAEDDITRYSPLTLRPDLTYFADMYYSRGNEEWRLRTSTDYKVKVWRLDGALSPGYAGTALSSTLQQVNYDWVITITGLGDISANFTTTEIGGDLYIDEPILLTYDSWATCEPEQQRYAVFADEFGQVDSTADNATRWQ